MTKLVKCVSVNLIDGGFFYTFTGPNQLYLNLELLGKQAFTVGTSYQMDFACDIKQYKKGETEQ